MLIINCDDNLINKARWDDERKVWYYGKTRENGALVGKWYTWYPSKKIKSISNNPDGLYTSWYENGQKEIEATYKNGYILGERKIWFPNGKLKRIEKWDEQKHLTYWKEWNTNEKTIQEAKEKNYRISGNFWYINGNKKQEGEYLNPGANWDGYWIFYFNNGKKSSEGKFKNGIHIGKHTDYKEDGSVKTVLYYDNERGEFIKMEEIK